MSCRSPPWFPTRGVRKIIGDKLAHSKFTAPHLYFTDAVDTTNLTAFRKQLNENSEVRIAVSDLLIMAACKALKKFPGINVTLKEDQIVTYKSINIGTAVAGDNGLVVPVVKNVQNKSLTDVAAESKDLVARAKEGRLKPEEYSNGTFSISNLGMFGVETFNPIINQPDAGILGVCAVQDELVMDAERVLTNAPYYAYIKLADGCDNRCTYCAIPNIRGRFRSRKMENILEEVRRFAAQGVTEMNLVAQDTTRYGCDLYGKSRLPELLRELCHIDGIRWVRVLYCYPERITDELLDVLAEEPHMVPYLDLPIQHCDGEILRRMHRPGNEEHPAENHRPHPGACAGYHPAHHPYHRIPRRDQGTVQPAGRFRSGYAVRSPGLFRLFRRGRHKGCRV